MKIVEKEKEHIAKKVEEIAVILNNKSKVYLKELKYIKSDGNYLEFITDEKKIIDRNKIKAILSSATGPAAFPAVRPLSTPELYPF